MAPKVSERTCVVCRRREPLLNPKKTGQELLLYRLVAHNGEVVVEQGEQRLVGRGAYVHRRIECLVKLLQAGRLTRALRIGDGSYKPQQVREVVQMLIEHATRSISGDTDTKGIPASGSVGRRGGENKQGGRRVRL